MFPVDICSRHYDHKKQPNSRQNLLNCDIVWNVSSSRRPRVSQQASLQQVEVRYPNDAASWIFRYIYFYCVYCQLIIGTFFIDREYCTVEWSEYNVNGFCVQMMIQMIAIVSYGTMASAVSRGCPKSYQRFHSLLVYLISCTICCVFFKKHFLARGALFHSRFIAL